MLLKAHTRACRANWCAVALRLATTSARLQAAQPPAPRGQTHNRWQHKTQRGKKRSRQRHVAAAAAAEQLVFPSLQLLESNPFR